MFPDSIITELERHKKVFESLLLANPKEMQYFKPAPDSWCLLEVLCHLLDEEVYDFRARVRHILETPADILKPISPKTWPVEHNYLNKGFQDVLKMFLEERTNSVIWLRGLKNATWEDKVSLHDLGDFSARTFLENWLAHDYLHIRQINTIKRAFLHQTTNEDLDYAGNW